MTFDFESLRDILVCPKSKSRLVYDGQTLTCTDADCRLRFEIRDDIPVMLVDEATELSPGEWKDVMARCSSGE
ncbi:MAG: hypothetical protein GXP27_09090 [Planctomycetes bacterium]|nr:hypothetical protein [Planctomycetota bacterium]